MAVRAMTGDDLDAVLAIAAALPFAPKWPRHEYVTALESNAWPHRVALVADLEGSVAGFAVAVVIAGEGEIESIAVAPVWQRRGVGAQLLRELQKALAGAGARAIVLEVRESNCAAVGLYRKAGFCAAGRRTGYYRDPAEDALLMRIESSRQP